MKKLLEVSELAVAWKVTPEETDSIVEDDEEIAISKEEDFSLVFGK